MAKSLSDYLTICFEVLTQVREGSARSRETEKERREKREKEQSHRPSFFSSSFDLTSSSKKLKKLNSPPSPQRLRLRSVPPIDEIGGPIEGLTCIVTGPTR